MNAHVPLPATAPADALSELPPGWEWISMEQLAQSFQNGISKRTGITGEPIIVLRLANIIDGKIDFSDTREVRLDQPELLKYCLSRNDLLCIRVNGSPRIVGRLVRVGNIGEMVSFCDHFIRLRPFDPEILSPFLAYYFETDSVRRYIELHMVSSAGQNTVNQVTIGNISIPLPPLAEQRRIIEAIETELTRLDAGVASLRAARAKLRRYRASVLKAACEGRLVAQDPSDEPASALLQRILAERRARWAADLRARGKDLAKARYEDPAAPDVAGLPELPVGWVWATAEQLSDETRSITYGVVKLGDPVVDGIPTLRSSNVRHLKLELDEVKTISAVIASDYKRTFLRGKEVLVTVRGTLGGVVVVPDMCSGYNISREVAMICLVDNSIADLVAFFIGSPTLNKWLTQRTRGIAYTGINIETLKELPLPLPPLAEQRRIVAEVERRLSVIATLEAAVAANLKRAERLRQAILKRAFEGRLVPQDPSDEPASALLERIRVEQGRKASNGRRGSSAVRAGLVPAHSERDDHQASAQKSPSDPPKRRGMPRKEAAQPTGRALPASEPVRGAEQMGLEGLAEP